MNSAFVLHGVWIFWVVNIFVSSLILLPESLQHRVASGNGSRGNAVMLRNYSRISAKFRLSAICKYREKIFSCAAALHFFCPPFRKFWVGKAAGCRAASPGLAPSSLPEGFRRAWNRGRCSSRGPSPAPRFVVRRVGCCHPGVLCPHPALFGWRSPGRRPLPLNIKSR